MKMKNKIVKGASLLFLVFLFGFWLFLEIFFLRPPVYYDVSSWIYWILFFIFLTLVVFVPVLKHIYWYTAWFLTGVGALLIVFFDDEIERFGTKTMNIAFVFWMVALVIFFITSARNKNAKE